MKEHPTRPIIKFHVTGFDEVHRYKAAFLVDDPDTAPEALTIKEATELAVLVCIYPNSVVITDQDEHIPARHITKVL